MLNKVAAHVTFISLCTMVSASTFAMADAPKQIDIPSGELSVALLQLAKQSGADLVYRPEQIYGVRTRGVHGSLTTEQAVTKLLYGTKLELRMDPSGAMLIAPGAGTAQPPISSSAAAHSGASDGATEGNDNSSGSFRVAQLDQGAAPGTSTVTDAAPAPLQEVLVTAQKRVERQQDVPASMTVLSGDILQDQGVEDLSDFAKQVPGLTLIASAGPGRNEVALRGISAGSGSHPLVGIYLDDVPFSASSPNANLNTVLGGTLDPDLADIERIEVLEGPQSTLYGASSMGGVLKYVTKQPELNNFSGNIGVDGSQVDAGGAGYGMRASVNAPIVTDTMALRASVFYRDDPGFVDNLYYGIKDINHDSVKGGRLSLLIKFTDDLQTTVSGFVQNIDSLGQDLVYVNPTTLHPTLGTLAYSSAFNDSISVKTESISDTTTYNLHFATLTNVASYAFVRDDTSGLDDGGYASFTGEPAGFLQTTLAHYESKRLTDELRLASEPDKVEWLLGVFYTHENDPGETDIRGTDPTAVIVPPSSPYYNAFTGTFNSVLFEEKAVFGDLTYHLTSQLEATVGARYSSDIQSFDETASGTYNGTVGPTETQEHSSDSATTYLATISYKPISEMSVYARAASAYRPGGPDFVDALTLEAGAPTSFGPDLIWNYEIGIKGSEWNQRIVYSADLFHMSWESIQLNVIYPDAGTIVQNASSAKSNGVEGSLQMAPVDGLTVSLSAAYIDAELTGPIASPVDAVKGDPLPYAPKVSGAALLDYKWGEIAGFRPRAGLTYAYHGSEHTNFTTSAGYTLPSYATVDLRGGFDWSRYSLIARIDNVTNKYALTDVEPTFAVGLPQGGIVLKPRTFGISLAAHF